VKLEVCNGEKEISAVLYPCPPSHLYSSFLYSEQFLHKYFDNNNEDDVYVIAIARVHPVHLTGHESAYRLISSTPNHPHLF